MIWEGKAELCVAFSYYFILFCAYTGLKTGSAIRFSRTTTARLSNPLADRESCDRSLCKLWRIIFSGRSFGRVARQDVLSNRKREKSPRIAMLDNVASTATSGKEAITHDHIYDHTACKKWQYPREEPRKNARLCSTVFWLSHDIYFAERLANPHESPRRRETCFAGTCSRIAVSRISSKPVRRLFVVLDPHCPRTLCICVR